MNLQTLDGQLRRPCLCRHAGVAAVWTAAADIWLRRAVQGTGITVLFTEPRRASHSQVILSLLCIMHYVASLGQFS